MNPFAVRLRGSNFDEDSNGEFGSVSQRSEEYLLQRTVDVSRVNFFGDNIVYFAPCGYVAPSYYDSLGTGFLKSFTAGFFTTCGLSAVGLPCFYDGEELLMHGTVSNTPATLYSVNSYEVTDNDVLRENGTLKFLNPGENALTGVKFQFINDINDFAI